MEQGNQSAMRIDLDAPIYRIFSVWGFDAVLSGRRMSLVQPRAWDDPFERLNEGVQMLPAPGQPYVSIAATAPTAYAQCWSATRESDTLWRAYSRVTKDPRFKRNIHPAEEGVKVKTTPRKLLYALCKALGEPERTFVGLVRYMSEDEIAHTIAQRIRAEGQEAYATPSALADFYLMKRDAFSHENEVRLLLVRDRIEGEPAFVDVEIDPNELFEEAQFDPRLEAFEAIEREAVFRTRGYTGDCPRSPLYVSTLMPIALPD